MRNKQIKQLIECGKGKYKNQVCSVIIAFLIAVITLIVYFTGGTTSTVHLMYIPIFLSIFVFGIKGGIIVSIVAGFAVGPFMPRDTVAHTIQPTLMWILRIVIFIIVVIVVGTLSERAKRANEIEKKEAYKDIKTGYLNINKFKIDLKKMISKENCSNISVIVFECTNLEMIQKYTSFKTSKNSYLELLSMADEFFEKNTIYNTSNNRFLVILQEQGAEEARDIAEKFISTTTEPMYIGGFPISLVVNGGVVNYPFHDSNSSDITIKLEKALEQANNSHNKVEIYDNDLDVEQEKYFLDLVSLYYALQNDKFTLVYQPKIDIQNEKIIGVEALLRWNDKNHKNMAISKLISRAEEAGFISQITKWVINNAAKQLKIWNEKGIDTAVSINLSSRDLTDKSFVKYVKNSLETIGVNPENFELELTERSIIQDEKAVKKELKRFRDMGIKLSLDDYGAGFNTVRYLAEFGDIFNYLKIDKFFIDKITDEESSLIVDCIINTAHRFGMKVIAEGVETKGQSNILKKLRCDMIQGYYYSKPLPPGEIEEFITNYK